MADAAQAQTPPQKRRMSGGVKAALALGASLLIHLGIAVYMDHASKQPRPPNRPISVQVVEVEKPKPPPPPPPEPPKPEPEKPKPLPPKPVFHELKPKPAPEPPTPPPPNQTPPPDAKPSPTPPVVLPGVTLESTSAGGNFAVNTGNTLYGDPGTKGHDPSEVHPYKAERYVAAVHVSEQPSVLNMESVNLRKYYPEEAKKNGFEADVVLRLMIDSDGSIVKVAVTNDPGEGLGDAAKLAIHELKFSPAKVDGVPVATSISFVLRFTLND